MNETLNDFSIGNGTNVDVMENEALEHQTDGQHNDFERFVDSASQNQFVENLIDDKIRRAVDYVDMIVGNRMHNRILTAMDKVAIRRVEMAVRLINASSGHGPNS